MLPINSGGVLGWACCTYLGKDCPLMFSFIHSIVVALEVDHLGALGSTPEMDSKMERGTWPHSHIVP